MEVDIRKYDLRNQTMTLDARNKKLLILNVSMEDFTAPGLKDQLSISVLCPMVPVTVMFAFRFQGCRRIVRQCYAAIA